MVYLLAVSIIWAFSFGLIKGNLTGLDSSFVGFARLFVSLLVFLPFLRFRNVNKQFASKLIFTGAIQYGFMYVFYIISYQYLEAYEVVLFTIFTPIYIAIINDILKKKFHLLFILTSILAVIGAAIVKYDDLNREGLVIGFIMMQISNICFAFGQVFYKKVMKEHGHNKDANIFAFLFMGGVIVTLLVSTFTTEWSTLELTTNHITTLLYLGVVASGIGFFLWNYGARFTDAGALAIFNNLKIPLGIAVSLIFFGEEADIARLLVGGVIVVMSLAINEWFVNQIKMKKATE